MRHYDKSVLLKAVNSSAMLETNDAKELSAISDEYVVSDLRAADRRAGHWVDEDPTLDRIIPWIRSQR